MDSFGLKKLMSFGAAFGAAAALPPGVKKPSPFSFAAVAVPGTACFTKAAVPAYLSHDPKSNMGSVVPIQET